VYGGGPTLEDYMAQTPLTVGSPQEVIDRTLAFREIIGDYQRQLFLIDHAGLPQKVVLEQLEMLGTLVVPVLRREFERLRAPGVPSDPPTHASLLAARQADEATEADETAEADAAAGDADGADEPAAPDAAARSEAGAA
jgi:hypothetical protein